MVWRWDIGEGQNGNSNAPENLRFQEVLEKGGRAIELASCVDDTPAEVRARCHDICISRMLPTAS